MFGGKSAFGTTPFGTTAQQSVFGTPQQSTSLFGAAKPTVSFGQPTQNTGGLFGTPATTASTGLFGTGTANTLFGTNAAATSTNLFGGAATTTTSSAFPAATGSLFSFSSNQPAAAQPAAGLFGQTTAASTSLFSTPATQQGTPVKYNPPLGQDQMVKGGLQSQVNTRHQCIAGMKEYENKSLEELRCEDYLLNRKGPQQQSMAFGTQPQQQSLGLFGQQQQTSSSLFGPTATQSTGLFNTGQTGGGLFGQSAATKPLFGQSVAATTSATAGFTFGAPSTSTATIGGLFGTTQQPTAATGGLFGTTTAGGGLFGTNTGAATSLFGTPAVGQQPNAAFAFGKPAQASTSIFGQQQQPQQSLFGTNATSIAQNTGFTFANNTNNAAPVFGTSSNLFAPKSTAAVAPFGASTFGTTQASTGLFGNQPAGSFNFATPQQQQQQPGGLFGTTATQVKPFGTGLFGTQSAFGQQQVAAAQPAFNFSTAGLTNTQAMKPGGFAFNSSTMPSLGSNFQQQTVSIGTDQVTLAAQQALIQSHLKGLAQSPYGDSKLLQLLKGRQAGSPTSPLSSVSPPKPLIEQSASFNGSYVSSPTVLNIKPIPPARPSPRILTMSINLNSSRSKDKKSLLTDADSDTLTFSEGYVPKRNVKKLILGRTGEKSKKAAEISSTVAANRNVENHSSSIFDHRSAITSEIKATPLTQPLPINFEDSVAEQEDNRHAALGTQERDGRPPVDYLSPIKPLTTPRHIRFAPTVSKEEPTADQEPFETHSTLYPKLSASMEDKNASEIDGIILRCGKRLEEKSPIKDNLTTSHSQNGTIPDVYPAGIICTRSDYYTVPDFEELSATVGPDGKCYVEGFTVGREEYGSVFWPGYLDIANLDIDSLVHFRHKEVTVYPDDTKKPTVGQGLNRTAEVTLDRVWPNDKTTHLPIKDVKRLESMRFREKLERASAQMNAEFVDYRPDTGSWVFKVAHFSKYGLLDDNDENEAAPHKRATLSPERMTADKVQRLKINVEPLVQSAEKSHNIVTQEKISAGLGGFSFPALDDDYVDLSSSEPSILVKSDLTMSFYADQDDKLSKLKQHLFYEPDYGYKEDDDQLDDSVLKSKLKKQCLMTDLYERSMHLLDKKSFIKTDVSYIDDYNVAREKTTEVPEIPSLQMIKPKNKLRLLPFENSLLKNLSEFYSDSGAFNARRFRPGWARDFRFVSIGLANKKNPTQGTLFSTGPHSSEGSSYTEIALMETWSDDGNRINLLELLTAVQLLNSVRYDRNGCPCFVPTNGAKSIDRYVKLISSLEWQQFSCPDKDYFAHVVLLCSTLWGKLTTSEIKGQSQYAVEITRKENLANWLAYVSSSVVNRPVEKDKTGKPKFLRNVLNLVTVGDLEKAADVAFRNGDVRLALSLSQLGGPEPAKALYHQQLSQWFQSQTDRYIEIERLKLYVLLAGRVEWKTSSNEDINPFESLTWKQSLSLHLRYCTPYTFTIADCTKLYDSSWSEYGNGIAIEPKADYCEALLNKDDVVSPDERQRLKNDVCYNLIKLFCERSYPLEIVLNNATWTNDALSYYLSWHLWCILSAVGYTTLSEQGKNALHLQYASQLERCGLWRWSVFVVMHITEDLDREKAVKRLLAAYASSSDDDSLKFLRNDLYIPEEWFEEAKTLKAAYDSLGASSNDS